MRTFAHQLPALVRERREALALTQQDLADLLAGLVDDLRQGALSLPDRKQADLVAELRNRRRLTKGG